MDSSASASASSTTSTPPTPTMPSEPEILTYKPPRNDPSQTHYDPTTPMANFFSALNQRMTPLGQSLYLHDRHVASEEADCQRCESHVSYLLRYSPTIRFLREKINELNGDLDASKVFCRRCPMVWTKDGGEARFGSGAGVNFDYGVQVCANLVRRRGQMEEVLAHEMVHIWDWLRWKVDEGSMRHAACTEIRASALSGECRWAKEFFQKHNMKVVQTHQDCVRKRAILSVAGRPFCENDVQATRAVNEVWDSCYNDTRPFEEIYR